MISIFKSWKKGSILVTDAGWGDSGKGKVVSALKPQIAVKIIGGHNAGHTVVTSKGELGLGLVPSSVIQPGVINVIGQEVVINPSFLIDEIKKIREFGIKLNSSNLLIDPRSHLIFPWHQIRDALNEEWRQKSAVGSLHLGVGWAYSDRINRRGLRLLDILETDWKAKVRIELRSQTAVIDGLKNEVYKKTGIKSKIKIELNEKEIFNLVEVAGNFLRSFTANTQEFVWKAIDKQSKILFEDSHGALLDITHGSWPYTTGVNTGLGAVYRSFGGKAVKSILKTIVCTKAYQTRVGGGPMPTENYGRFGNFVQKTGGEFGTRSGRPRRCGPIDIPILNYGYKILGLGPTDEIAITKLDVLSGLAKLPICCVYKVGNKIYDSSPSAEPWFLSKVKTKIKVLPGWSREISNIKSFVDLPKEARRYIKFLEKSFSRKITFVGVGKHKDSYIINNAQL